MPIQPQPQYLLPGQLAALLCVSPKTISRWIKEGKIVHSRTLGGGIGRGHARIPVEEADRLVEEMFRDAGRGRAEASS